MQITRPDNNSLVFEGDNVKFTFTLNETNAEGSHLVVGPNVKSDVARPGEYEYNDITVLCAEQRENLTGYANAFKIILDKVNIGYVGPDIKNFDKQTLEFLGQVDLLLVSKDMPKDAISSVANDLEPWWITLIDSVDPEQAKQLVGVTPTTVASKIKYKVDEAVEGESTLSCVIVTTK